MSFRGPMANIEILKCFRPNLKISYDIADMYGFFEKNKGAPRKQVSFLN